MSENKLKPCPFCRGETYASERSTCESSMSGHYRWFVTCSECGTESDGFYTEQEAIDAWNNRPIESELLEALKAVYNYMNKPISAHFTKYAQERIGIKEMINKAIEKAED